MIQVQYILILEDHLRQWVRCCQWVRRRYTPKKAKSKPYYDLSLHEMLWNKLIVVLWGGQSFDSRESNQKLLAHRKAFCSTHRVRHYNHILLVPAFNYCIIQDFI